MNDEVGKFSMTKMGKFSMTLDRVAQVPGPYLQCRHIPGLHSRSDRCICRQDTRHFPHAYGVHPPDVRPEPGTAHMGHGAQDNTRRRR